MPNGLTWTTLVSRSFLTSPWMLWSLFWINCLGTVYGYYWYWEQLVYTFANRPIWMILLVPDSPTSSLFFTLALIYLLRDIKKDKPTRSPLRRIIEVVAVITSFKYGIWAVVMIFAGAYQGVPMVWQDWMLIGSHLGMAVEAVLFARFFQIRPISWLLAALWVLGNDYVDYTYIIYPWLPKPLEDHIDGVAAFTWGLSWFTLLLFGWIGWSKKRRKSGSK
ncbi:DUF1405 domain-containing protein [Paenibacillus sp. J2TS4]|uniref:DUF1405 domain-containing protein n=1 Tax=Paenibacillus sp. J2TS4 TaxID=2807194 RepID=UPI001B062A1F|nr:DUF1405 domain-containing protein [Paenibacillus sp. J2TS4]GIP32414.1 hypothetical protein J2TS4_16240 [Paenibacillus sp. J2TS4]